MTSCLALVSCVYPPAETSAEIRVQAKRRVAWGRLCGTEMFPLWQSLDERRLYNRTPSVEAKMSH